MPYIKHATAVDTKQISVDAVEIVRFNNVETVKVTSRRCSNTLARYGAIGGQLSFQERR